MNIGLPAVTLRILSNLALLAAGLCLTGCASSKTVSASQANQSVAQVGESEAVVQRKMGRPDERRELAGRTVWIYENYLHRRTTHETTGWSEVLVPEMVDRRANTVGRPVSREIYRTRAKEDIRVTFKDGAVISVVSAPKR
jgi:hypothetical protein